MKNIVIEKIKNDEFKQIQDIYVGAINFMHSNNNKTQWNNNPSFFEEVKEILEKDLLFKVVKDKKIIAVFGLIKGPDPMYDIIINGSWPNDNPYYSIHKIASSFTSKNVFKYILDFAFTYSKTIRIDTHKNNIPMKKAIIKNGFEYCGVVFAPDKTERIAFIKCI